MGLTICSLMLKINIETVVVTLTTTITTNKTNTTKTKKHTTTMSIVTDKITHMMNHY